MKILIRSILVILALIALLGVLSITPFGQGIIGGDAARQACIDHMADQAAKGQPIPYRERLEQWAKEENRNLFTEPEIFDYLTKYERSSQAQRESMLEMAADRLLRGMEDCDTVSMVPIGIEHITIRNYYSEPAKPTMEWLDAFARKGRTFHGIILDPPTFSRVSLGKGRRKKSATWSVESDLASLVEKASQIIEPDGWILCSSNCRKMSFAQFDTHLAAGVRAAGKRASITHTDMPPDFTDTPYLHNAWLEF